MREIKKKLEKLMDRKSEVIKEKNSIERCIFEKKRELNEKKALMPKDSDIRPLDVVERELRIIETKIETEAYTIRQERELMRKIEQKKEEITKLRNIEQRKCEIELLEEKIFELEEKEVACETLLYFIEKWIGKFKRDLAKIAEKERIARMRRIKKMKERELVKRYSKKYDDYVALGDIAIVRKGGDEEKNGA
ncbi:MAG: hypothetical protein QXP42_04260 [Candidatus Micrarchaeia archaeon]